MTLKCQGASSNSLLPHHQSSTLEVRCHGQGTCPWISVTGDHGDFPDRERGRGGLCEALAKSFDVGYHLSPSRSELCSLVSLDRYTFCFNFLIIINYSKQCSRCHCRPSWIELVMKTRSSRVVYISLVIETSRKIVLLVYLLLKFPPLKGISYEHHVAFIRHRSKLNLPHSAYHKVGLG